MSAYYNEIDPKAAAWLRELIKRGLIAPGEVDERSILEVQPADLRGFTQCHFFAGIGVWSYALRLAGWSDDRPVWTGSCPCQPFSAAGKGDEFADERHLWPAWFRLARELRPDAIFGEQVSSKDALAWFDHVRVDLEGAGYALGVLDTCAAGVGAPHIRQRLYFVADASSGGRQQLAQIARVNGKMDGEARPQPDARGGRHPGRLADAERWATERHGLELGSEARGSEGEGDQRQRIRHDAKYGEQPSELAYPDGRNASTEREQRSGEQRLLAQGGGSGGPLADPTDPRRPGAGEHDGGQPLVSARPVEHGGMGHADGQQHEGAAEGAAEGAESSGREGFAHAGAVNGFWASAEWVPCRDGKARPTQSRLVALAPGVACGMVFGGDSGKSAEAEKAAWVTPDCNNHRDGTKLRTDSNLGAGTHGVSLHHLVQLAGDNYDGQIHGVISEIGSDGEAEVRSVRDGQAEIACPPQGRESAEQRTIEFADFVRLLPSARALAELSGDAHTSETVSALLQGVGEAWAVQHASDSGEAIWRSLDEESQNRVRLGFDSGRWMIGSVFPLVTGAPARVVRLRGYGNAINAEQARHFIEAFIEVTTGGQ